MCHWKKIKPPRGTDPSIQLECKTGMETGGDRRQLHKEPLWPPGWAAAKEAPPCPATAAPGSFCLSPQEPQHRKPWCPREKAACLELVRQHAPTAEQNTSHNYKEPLSKHPQQEKERNILFSLSTWRAHIVSKLPFPRKNLKTHCGGRILAQSPGSDPQHQKNLRTPAEG